MIRKTAIAGVLLSAAVLIFGQSAEEFSRVVDFSVTMKELGEAALAGSPDAFPRKFVLVDGAVASRAVITAGPQNFLGEIELVSGEWIGVEDVVMYRCIVQLVGPQFAAAIPARRTRQESPDEIRLNSRILVVGRVTDVRVVDDGAPVPVVQAYFIRTIN